MITAVAGKAISDVLELQRVLNEQPADKCRELSVCGHEKAVAVTE